MELINISRALRDNDLMIRFVRAKVIHDAVALGGHILPPQALINRMPRQHAHHEARLAIAIRTCTQYVSFDSRVQVWLDFERTNHPDARITLRRHLRRPGVDLHTIATTILQVLGGIVRIDSPRTPRTRTADIRHFPHGAVGVVDCDVEGGGVDGDGLEGGGIEGVEVGAVELGLVFGDVVGGRLGGREDGLEEGALGEVGGGLEKGLVGGEGGDGVLDGGGGDEAAEEDRREEGEEPHGKCNCEGFWGVFLVMGEVLVVEEDLVVVEKGNRKMDRAMALYRLISPRLGRA